MVKQLSSVENAEPSLGQSWAYLFIQGCGDCKMNTEAGPQRPEALQMVIPSDPGMVPLLGICPSKIRAVHREMHRESCSWFDSWNGTQKRKKTQTTSTHHSQELI